MFNNTCVKRVARKANTTHRYDCFSAVFHVAHSGADMQQAKVTRAAAEVTNQHKLVMGQRLFVSEGGSHRFELELHIGKARTFERRR